MGTLRIKLLGQPSLHQDDRPIATLSAKALEMLCYLFLYRDRPHTREALAEVLWSDVSAERAQKYLRQTLWQLQSALDIHSDTHMALITLGPGWLRINPKADWWFDVDTLEQAYQLCRETGAPALNDEQARLLELAAELYEGDLLVTWHHDWCIYERERLQLTYLAILDCLMNFCEIRQAYTRGVAHGQNILRYDPARESTYRQLMRLRYLAGDRTTALREYRRCEAALRREFDLPPSQQTIQLYELIRADRRAEIVAASARPPSSAPQAPRPPAELYTKIEHLQASLTEFQAQIQRELAAIAHLL